MMDGNELKLTKLERWLYPELCSINSSDEFGALKQSFNRSPDRRRLRSMVLRLVVVMFLAVVVSGIAAVQHDFPWSRIIRTQVMLLVPGAIALVLYILGRYLLYREFLRAYLFKQGIRLCAKCNHDLSRLDAVQCPKCGRPYKAPAPLADDDRSEESH